MPRPTNKCKRCRYCWLPCGDREIGSRTYFTDVGICPECKNATSRVRVATAGDIVDAMLWGSRFQLKRVDRET